MKRDVLPLDKLNIELDLLDFICYEEPTQFNLDLRLKKQIQKVGMLQKEKEIDPFG
jgi:hypothetical protein